MPVRGGASLMRKFGKLTSSAQAQLISRAVLAGAEPIKNRAKELAPYKTGELRRSITTSVLESTPTMARVAIGSDKVYARRIEYGFVGKDSLGRRYNQAAKPYLRPALDEKRNEAVREMKEAFREMVLAAVK